MNNKNIQELEEDRLCVFGEDYDEVCCCIKNKNDDSMNLNSKFKSILLSFGARNSIDDEPNFELFHNNCSTLDTISSESNDLLSLDSIILDQFDNECVYYENILNHNNNNSNESNCNYNNNYQLFTSPSPSPSSTNDNFNDFNVKFNLTVIDTDDIYDDFCETENSQSNSNTNNVNVNMLDSNANIGETRDNSSTCSNNNVISHNETLTADADDSLLFNKNDNIDRAANELATDVIKSEQPQPPTTINIMKPAKRELNDRLKSFLQENSKSYQINKSTKFDCESATIRKTLKLNNKPLDTKVDWLKEILKSNNRIKKHKE